jgi:flagellar M-ring protein FliF
MSTETVSNSMFEQLKSLSKLPIARQIAFVILLTGTLSLGLALVLWSSADDYVPVYPSLSLQDSAEIMALLDRQGIKYKIESVNGMITVNSGEVQAIKLMLANQGLPRTVAGAGFNSLNEESSLGSSQFMEQARFTRALEQELMQTIKLINGVRDVRVHLSIPRQSSFIRSTGKANGSVMLDLINGRQLNENQIAGIRHLVASSVSGLDIEDVSIVDQRGNLLSKMADNEFTISSDHFQLTRALERDYAQRINEILAPIVGEDKVRTQITAELDFTILETTAERYDPASSVIRSEQLSDESQSSTPVIEPGLLAQAPPVVDNLALQNATNNQQMDTQQTRTTATRNFEIDKIVSYSKAAPGTIKRLSVAVVVDLGIADSALNTDEQAEELAVSSINQNAEKLERLRQLVMDAVGFNAARGDTIFITNEALFQPVLDMDMPGLPFWQDSWIQSLIKQTLVGLFAIFIALSVLKPAMNAVFIPKSNELPGRQAGRALTGPGKGQLAVIDDDDGDGDDYQEFKPGSGKLVVGLNNPRATANQNAIDPVSTEYEQNINVLQRLIDKEPMRVSKIVGDWANK